MSSSLIWGNQLSFFTSQLSMANSCSSGWNVWLPGGCWGWGRGGEMGNGGRVKGGGMGSGDGVGVEK